MKFVCILVLILPLVLSCKKEDPGSAVSACGVNNPVQNLPWLKDMIENTGTEELREITSVRLFEYKGETYIDYASPLMSCMTCMVFDCAGNRVDLSEKLQESEYSDFVNASRGASSVILWKGKDAW